MTEPTVRYPWPADLDARESWWDDDLTRDQKYEIIDDLAEPVLLEIRRPVPSRICLLLLNTIMALNVFFGIAP